MNPRTHTFGRTVVVGAALALLASGCAGQETVQTAGNPEEQSRSVSSSAPSSPATSPSPAAPTTGSSSPVRGGDGGAASTRTPATPPGSPEHPCDARVALQDALASAGRPAGLPDARWMVTDSSLLCSPLGWAFLDTDGGTASSPTQLLLFHEGRYLGTGTTCEMPASVTGHTDDSVTLLYRWSRPGESTAGSSGRTTVTYRWDGTRVRMEGAIPPEATGQLHRGC